MRKLWTVLAAVGSDRDDRSQKLSDVAIGPDTQLQDAMTAGDFCFVTRMGDQHLDKQRSLRAGPKKQNVGDKAGVALLELRRMEPPRQIDLAILRKFAAKSQGLLQRIARVHNRQAQRKGLAHAETLTIRFQERQLGRSMQIRLVRRTRAFAVVREMPCTQIILQVGDEASSARNADETATPMRWRQRVHVNQAAVGAEAESILDPAPTRWPQIVSDCHGSGLHKRSMGGVVR